MCVGMRVGHRNDDSDTHVPAARSSKMRLYRESEVGLFLHGGKIDSFYSIIITTGRARVTGRQKEILEFSSKALPTARRSTALYTPVSELCLEFPSLES